MTAFIFAGGGGIYALAVLKALHEKNTDDKKVNCDKCNDDHYILQGCCSGRECGCRGGPVSMINCKSCNPDADKPHGEGVAEYAEHIEFFKV